MKLDRIPVSKMTKLNIVVTAFFSLFSGTVMSIEKENSKSSGYTEFFHTSENNSQNKTYLSKEEEHQLNPTKGSDAEKLAKSIEFEVYEVSEKQMAHTIFKSGAGICRGFKSHYGVDMMDSRTYYIDQTNDEYYASISGATLYSHNSPENIQYAPVFNIRDDKIAEKIQNEETKYGKQLATKNIEQNSDMLKETICK